MRVSVMAGIAAAVLAFILVAYVTVMRPWHLRWGATDVEAVASLPGDNLVPGAPGQVTRAVTIDAPAEKIWPWLMQIGQDRSGFYSYTPLENLIGADMPKVHELRPEWGARVPGEAVWFGTPKRFKGQAKMIAALVDQPHAFVMVMPGDWEAISKGGNGSQGSWGFFLVPVDNGHTRLIARLRSGRPPNLRTRLAGSLFWEPSHFVMERKMLLTIKELAESK